MADRVVRFADEDEKDRQVDDVFFVRKEEVSDETKDPFSRSGEWVKSLSGTTSNFKRKVTNELKKYNKSADGKTESKQIYDEREVTGYDAFGVVQPIHNMDTFIDLYELSAPHYAAINAKVSNIVGLGFNLVETTRTKRAVEEVEGNEAKLSKIRRKLNEHRDELYDTIESWNDDESLPEVLEKIWRDYEVTGNGYIEIGRKADGTIGYVGHIPAHTMRIRKDRDGYVQISANRAQFFKNFGDASGYNPVGTGRANEVIHIKRYSPKSAYYGIPDVIAAQYAIAGNDYAAKFNIEYFENKAVPRHLITLKGASLGSAARADLLQFFETGLKGQNHRALFIPLPPDNGTDKVEFKIEPVDAAIQDASFEKYKRANLEEILMAHRVPISKVSTASGASLAIARDADKTFKEQVCQPQQRTLEKKLNRILKEFTDAFEFKLNEMSLTDADTQSKIDERMVKAGIWLPNEPRIRDGRTAIKGGDERVDLNAKDKLQQAVAEERTQRQRDSERSAGATDSAGEARNPKGDGRTVT